MKKKEKNNRKQTALNEAELIEYYKLKCSSVNEQIKYKETFGHSKYENEADGNLSPSRVKPL